MLYQWNMKRIGGWWVGQKLLLLLNMFCQWNNKVYSYFVSEGVKETSEVISTYTVIYWSLANLHPAEVNI